MKKSYVDIYGEDYFRKHWAAWVTSFSQYSNQNPGNDNYRMFTKDQFCIRHASNYFLDTYYTIKGLCKSKYS